MGLPLPKYEPIIHATFYLTGVTYRFATDDYYDGSGNYFKGTLLPGFDLTRQLSDLYYGVEDSKSITLSFSNGANKLDPTWDEIVETNNKELRGKAVLVERFDPTDGTSFEIRGIITAYTLGSTVSITIEMRDDYTLEKLLPADVVTTDTFTPTALDVGEPINLCIGYCRNVPLRNIMNSDSIAISAITKANPGKVTTSTAHNLTTGDYVFHTFIEGMTELNALPTDLPTLYQITVVDADEYTLGVDTSGYGVYTANGNMHPRKYDYLIGYSTLENLWVDHGHGLGVKRDGVLVTTSEYTFHDGAGTPYNGYAFIRFLKEQKDFTGKFYKITADVKGFELGGSIAERNFATVVKNILSDATWGLSDSVDAASFAAAATALNGLGYTITGVDVGNERFQIDGDHTAFFLTGRRFRVVESTGNDGDWIVSTSAFGAGTTTITVTGDVTDATVDGYIDRMYCDGAVTKQRKARDIIDEILEPARARIWRATDGEWEIAVDVTGGASVLSLGDNDGFYNNCEVLSTSITPINNALQTAIVQYSQDPSNEDNPFKELSVAVHTGFGEEKTYELPFVMEDDTAIMMLSYLKNRSLYSDKRATIRGGMECRDLTEGQIITLTAPLRDISARTYMIQSISKGIADFELDVRESSVNIYGDEVVTPPTVQSATGITVSGASAIVGNVTLGDGTQQSAQITMDLAAGLGDIYIAAGTIDVAAWTAASGFILGIDDTDDLAKFFVGDTTSSFMNWSGAAMAFQIGAGDALTVKGGGDIILEDGGDIILASSDANPALIKWSTTYNLGAATTASRGLCIWPTIINTTSFRLGFDPVGNAEQPFEYIYSIAYVGNTVTAKRDVNNIAYFHVNAGPASGEARIHAKALGNVYELRLNAIAAAFYPEQDNTIDLGIAATKEWKHGFFSGDLYVRGLINADGGQIAFPATKNPSADANTMDDYEEGYHTATVVCSTSGNYTLDDSEEELAYTKVGRVVHIQGTLHITGENAPNGQLRVSIPFPVAALTDRAEQCYVPIVITNHGDAGIENPVAFVTTGLSYLPLYNILDDGTEETVNDARVDTNFYIHLNFSYIAA